MMNSGDIQIVPEDNESPMTSYQNRSASHDHLPSYYDTATRYYFKNHDLSDRSILPDAYPSRSNSSILHPDLSRALRVDAHLLAIVRIEDRRSNLYATEVVNKLRQKELTQSFINKPCSLYVTDRALKIVDRMSQNIAESIPLENIDPTCLESETPDTLNDIFMYRLYERHSNQLNNSTHSTNSYDRMSTVVVFKCSNRESKVLVDSIRSAAAKQLRQPRSARSESRNTTTNRTGPMPIHAPPPAQTIVTDLPASRPMTPRAAEDHYKRLTIELNKCFDDIELFVRRLEVVTGYTRELERSRRKGKKNHPPNTTTDELPEDKYFVDVLQKFKHSFNLIGELKHIIHNPNGPELIHYLLSPLQFILVSLRQKSPNQAQLAQSIRTPVLIKDARDLLVNCLTSREHEIIKNLGPAWLPANDETVARPTDYRPIFFDGREPWTRTDFDAIPSARTTNDRRSPAPPPPPLPSSARSNPTRHVSPSVGRNETSTIDRSMREGSAEIYTSNQQNEHSWAIERKRAGAKICAVKNDRPGHNSKELSVRRGELIEILDDAKNWWRARNFQGKIGHVPNNILEEIDIEQRSLKNPSTNPSVAIPRSSSVPMRVHGGPIAGHERRPRGNEYNQFLLRSPSNGNNFIMQSTHSTTTRPMITRQDFFQPQSIPSGSNLSSAVPAAPPPPPAPPLPSSFSSPLSSPWSTLQMPNSSRDDRSRSQMNTTPRQQDKLQKELAQRINDRVGVINQTSTKDEVQRWLISKQISPELAQNLRDMNGEQLFQLTPVALERFANQSEASRLFALLVQQKQLAGYHIDEFSDSKNSYPNFGFGSLKSRTPRDVNDSFGLRPNDSLSRSLKIKLKQRRDKIEQAETTAETVL